MDLFLAFMSGISAKLYDDLHDNNLFKNDILKESLKGSQWILLTLLSYNDFNFSIVAYFANVLTVFSNWQEWNYPYETSLLIFYPFLIILSFSTRKMITLPELLLFIGIAIGMWIEPSTITEEYSYRKLIQRIIQCIISIICVIGSIYFNISTSFIKLMMFSVGYCMLSSMFQFYMLSQDNLI